MDCNIKLIILMKITFNNKMRVAASYQFKVCWVFYQSFSLISARSTRFPKSKEQTHLELISWSITRLLIFFNFLIIGLIVLKRVRSLVHLPTLLLHLSFHCSTPPPCVGSRDIDTHLFCHCSNHTCF